MNRIRLLAAAAIILMALIAHAQQTSGAANQAEQTASTQHKGKFNSEEHLRMLSDRLDLTADQQEKLRPILQNMSDEMQKLAHDQDVFNQQRDERQRAIHEKADHEARKFLNEEQKKKLDELEAQHHAGSAGQTHP